MVRLDRAIRRHTARWFRVRSAVRSMASPCGTDGPVTPNHDGKVRIYGFATPRGLGFFRATIRFAAYAVAEMKDQTGMFRRARNSGVAFKVGS